ncbi:MAG TPA: hypothetical protein VG273_23960 [Bryobacteraceae bacterium]|jgi:hypothetical protein|nr:hypothetical protein [Bryobacteraceae bacterium]
MSTDRKLSVFGIVLTVLGLILGGLVLESRPTIALGTPSDPKNILTTEVVVSNDGALALEDVDIAVFIRSLTWPTNNRIDGDIGTTYQPPSREMAIGDRKTIQLAPFLTLSSAIFTSADIGLLVCYRPIFVPSWIWPIHPRVFRFDSITQSDGYTRLRQQPDDGKLLKEYAQLLAQKGQKPCQREN